MIKFKFYKPKIALMGARPDKPNIKLIGRQLLISVTAAKKLKIKAGSKLAVGEYKDDLYLLLPDNRLTEQQYHLVFENRGLKIKVKHGMFPNGQKMYLKWFAKEGYKGYKIIES